MANCTSCNKELALNAKYCKFCGASQVVKPQASSNTPVVTKVELAPACAKCGNTLTLNAKFCKHCGTNVITVPVNILPITETPKVVAVSTIESSNKTKSKVARNKVTSSSIDSVDVTNKKTGISGTQLSAVLVVIALLGILAFITTSPSTVATSATKPAAIAVVDPAQQARLKQAEAEQKKMVDDEAKRIAVEEKAAAVIAAEAEQRQAVNEKAQQEKDERLATLQKKELEAKLKQEREVKTAKTQTGQQTKNSQDSFVIVDINGDQVKMQIDGNGDQVYCSWFGGPFACISEADAIAFQKSKSTKK